MPPNRNPDRSAAQPGEPGAHIRWDDSEMRSAYANVCNVTGTREEIVLLFGINRTWNAAAKELVIQLQERVILNPFAAKRLNLLLTRILKEYESRYGPLPHEAADQPRRAEPLPAG
jgi:hypothetical protein